MLKEWFEEVKSSSRIITRFSSTYVVSYIYKGFKISHDSEKNLYSVQDTRYNDFYTDVKSDDLEVLKENGFIKGCDIIMINRDERRVDKYSKIMTRLMDTFNKCTVKSRKKTLQNQLNEATDLYFFYKTRLKQLKSKYETQGKMDVSGIDSGTKSS